MNEISVLTMPMFDPGQGRREMQLLEGLTIEAIIGLAIGKLSPGQRARLQVILADSFGNMMPVIETTWRRVRPHAGVRVLLRLTPGNDDLLRPIMTIAVTVAAIALGQLWALPVASALGLGGSAIAVGLIGAGITAGIAAIGGMLINALVPAKTAAPGQNGRDAEKPTFAISGWRNGGSPGGIVPAPLGRIRIAPNFAAMSYTEIVGDEQYVRALFVAGYGPLAISDIRIGKTPVSSFNNVEFEVRQGLPGDDPCQLYPQQVLEEALGVELRRDYPRDSQGAPITSGGAGSEDPVSRNSAADVTEIGIIIGWPAGLVEFNNEGTAVALGVDLRIEHRPANGVWSTVANLNFVGRQTEGFYRAYRWAVPVRGPRYEVRVVRVTPERTSAQQSDRTVWVALQGFRPEYPLNFGKPLALLSMRVRATHQLNGSLDSVNFITDRICPDWDHASGTWIMRETRNPASLYRYVLQGDAATFPEADAGLTLGQLQDWHDFCRVRGLKYDRNHDFEASQFDVLMDVASAGRASPRHDGSKWGLVIDRSGEPIIDHISGINASDFSWSRTYFRAPDAFRVTFLDETNDYQSAERVVPWPGGAGDIEVTQALQLPGKTDPAEIWRETRRRQYEMMHRPDRFTATQAGAARRVTRGDRVLGAFDTLEHTLAVYRADRVIGQLVALGGDVTMEVGKSYACRFRVFGEDGGMQSVVRSVVTQPGERGAILLSGSGEVPAPGEPVHFGIAGKESISLIVTGVEAGENMTSIIHAVAEAPEIEALTDAEVPPAWDGRVGGAIDNDTTAPARPIVRGVELHLDGFSVLLAPDGSSAVPVARFALRYRLVGSPIWSGPITGPAGAGSLALGGYGAGDSVQWQAQAISAGGVGSLWTDIAVVTLPIPEGAPGPIVSASATVGLGFVGITLATPADDRLAEVRIYRGNTGTFGTANLVATLLGALPASSYSHIDGDATRVNLVADPGFDTGSPWVLGDDWAIGSGKAFKMPGEETAVEQVIGFVPSRTYRYRVEISDRTDGELTIGLAGAGSAGDVHTSNGAKLGAIFAIPGDDALAFTADADFDGAIDNVVVFEETATSVPQGTHFYFLTTANAAGTESAPFALGPITVI